MTVGISSGWSKESAFKVSVTAEILLIGTNVARTNVARTNVVWTNVTMTA